MRIFYIVNVDWFFLSHRLPLALAMKEKEYEVYVLTRDTGKRMEIEKNGLQFIPIDFDRSGINPMKDLVHIAKIRRLVNRYKPDIIHNVTIKPAIYGTIAARASVEKPKIINAISGLGYNFTDGRNGLVQKFLKALLLYAFKSGVTFIFQNTADSLVYESQGLLDKNDFRIIKGSGVDATEFAYQPPPRHKVLKVVLTARLLFDKGIMEFIAAAKLLSDKWYGKVRFIIVGENDKHNKASIPSSLLNKQLMPGYIDWIGFQEDVRGILRESDIVCLPSYREGLPKSLIEAMAIGRPIVTTDVPGCRECVDHGLNGYLVPVKDAIELADAINSLLSDDELRLKMGVASRKKMESELSLEQVIRETIAIYDQP